MKAVRFHRYGDPSVLRCEEAPIPAVSVDDVLIRVHAAGINPADTQFRRGDYQAFVPLELPFIPGWDVAGTVAAVGAGVTRWHAGETVFAMADMARIGACAEFIAVRDDAMAPAPTRVPLAQAAAVPLAALTAWSALFDHAGLQAGQSVLVHAGAGGVGLFAIQLARHAGAEVIATASAANHELLRTLGAHRTVDYRSAGFDAEVKGVDVVLDTVGGETRTRSWPMLREGGILVGIAMPPPDEAVAARHRVRTAMVRVQPNGKRLAEIAALIDAAVLRIVIDREFPLEEAVAAHVRSESRHACGKIILRVRD